jgi:hypothetical protein
MPRTSRFLIITLLGAIAVLILGMHGSAHAAAVSGGTSASPLPQAYPYNMQALSPQVTTTAYTAALYMAVAGLALLINLPVLVWGWIASLSGWFRNLGHLTQVSKAR